jgi:CcmD family protein
LNWYLFFGYAIFWTLVFIYLVYLNGRQRELNRELEELRESLKE